MRLQAACLALLLLSSAPAAAQTNNEIMESNERAIVYIEQVDASGAVVDHGTGFIISHDGYVLTAAHLLPPDIDHKLYAVIGQKEGTKFPLNPRDRLDQSGAGPVGDVALLQLPQATACRYAVTLGRAAVQRLAPVLVIGFPGTEGLTPSPVAIQNTTSNAGFYKANGLLEPGNSGGPVFNAEGQVVAIVQGGTVVGAESNDLIPIASAIDLAQRHGVAIGVDAAVPFADACYASCANPANGVASWEHQDDWHDNTGWLDGGSNQVAECTKLMAAKMAQNPGSQVELLPGSDVPDNSGRWEISKKEFGFAKYKYFCKGKLLSDPVYVTKRSPVCGLQD